MAFVPVVNIISNILIIICLINGLNGGLNDILDDVELDVKKLLQVLYNDLPNRCNINKNNKCSYISCSKNKPNLLCNNDFKIDACQIENCDPVGHLLNTEQFMVRLANQRNNNDIVVTQEVKEMVNGSYGLHAKFKEIFFKSPKIYNPKWMYFGTYNGVHMSYPGKEVCSPYDNRFRPWYLGAITGVKNLIFVIDISGPMLSDISQKDNLMAMIDIILHSVLYSDRIGIITFNSIAKSHFRTLVFATVENVNTIRNILNRIIFTGQTNLESAFQTINDLLKNTAKQGLLLACKINIMLFTYGSPTDGIVDKVQLIDRINKLDCLNNVRLFAYSFSNDDYTKEIACLKNGAYEYVKIRDNLYTKLNSYFTLISIGSNLTDPVWVEVYTDSSGLGLMTTCAIPVYEKTINNTANEVPFYRIYGVVAIDILVEDLIKYGCVDDINKELRKRTIKSCSSSSFEPTECQLNSLRTNKCSISDNTCNELKYLIPPCASDNIPYNDIFCNEKDYTLTQNDIDNCCISACKVKGALIGGLLGSIILLVGVGVLIWYFLLRKSGDEDGDRDRDGNGNNQNHIPVADVYKAESADYNLPNDNHLDKLNNKPNKKGVYSCQPDPYRSMPK